MNYWLILLEEINHIRKKFLKKSGGNMTGNLTINGVDVLKKGDYGIGSKAIDKSGTDLNALLGQGSQLVSGNNMVNGPDPTSYYYIEHYDLHLDGFAYQKAFRSSPTAYATDTYVRCYSGSSWQPWVRVLTEISQPIFQASLNANVPISNDVDTIIPFNAENMDTHNGFNPSIGKYTVQKDGIYEITISAFCKTQVGATSELFIRHGSMQYQATYDFVIDSTTHYGGWEMVSGSVLIKCIKGDTIDGMLNIRGQTAASNIGYEDMRTKIEGKWLRSF